MIRLESMKKIFVGSTTTVGRKLVGKVDSVWELSSLMAVLLCTFYYYVFVFHEAQYK